MDTNDSLRLASLWHSMHAISQQLSPIMGCAGIELLQADTFDLHCFQSLTGTKFFVVCEPGTQHMEPLLKYIYELYTDYVLKNPFYEMEMPIRCELFDINLGQAVQKDRVALLGR
nr:trafficking protein particle complex subunit 4 [Ipomoea batatas]GMD07288.1 trafficking protein particle complex subunit 4 [Ipomoea batatas]GMD09343.1 trafficking protein particle complex subunit 4 [Ipomoea batatas]GMD10688.1 trafficking protein particle complex subunit 4 [Ipomoea batatas]GMD12056.1 trafficking protein particle complex subunit 4 [Ipomoea batatas]